MISPEMQKPPMAVDFCPVGGGINGLDIKWERPFLQESTDICQSELWTCIDQGNQLTVVNNSVNEIYTYPLSEDGMWVIVDENTKYLLTQFVSTLDHSPGADTFELNTPVVEPTLQPVPIETLVPEIDPIQSSEDVANNKEYNKNVIKVYEGIVLTMLGALAMGGLVSLPTILRRNRGNSSSDDSVHDDYPQSRNVFSSARDALEDAKLRQENEERERVRLPLPIVYRPRPTVSPEHEFVFGFIRDRFRMRREQEHNREYGTPEFIPSDDDD